jgi:hypothetical protein
MRTRLATLICVAAMLAMALGPAVALADGPAWQVDGAFSGAGCNSTTRQCRTIQSAVDAAADGDTINVAAGNYPEQLTIDKPNLTLRSIAGSAVTIIDVPAGPLTVGIDVLKDLGVITIDGFTVKAITESGIVQRMSQAAGTALYVYNNKVMPAANYLRNGIQVSGNGSRVIGNHVIGKPLTAVWDSSGIMVVNASNVLVQGNTVDGSDSGISVHNYSVGSMANITIDGNTVHGAEWGIGISGKVGEHRIVNDVVIRNNALDDGGEAGIGVEESHLTNLTVTGNRIVDNVADGIWIQETVSTTLAGNVGIHDNYISGNGKSGITNLNSTVVDATGNWWGSFGGPCKPGDPPSCTGFGDKVTANVVFAPFISEALEVGEVHTLDTRVTADGVYGAQLVVNHNNSVLNFVSGVTNSVESNPLWAWDWPVKSFTQPVSGTTELAGTMKERIAGANLAGQSIATWTYRCFAPGTSTLTYDTTAGTGTFLSSKNGFSVANVFTGDSITCLAATSAVNGNIGLQGRVQGATGSTGWLSSTVTLTCTGGACVDSGPYALVTDANGYYQYVKSGPGTGIANGTYTAVAARRGYLAATKTGIAVTGGAFPITPVPTLLGGDVTSEDVGIGILDLGMIGTAFGQEPSGGADTGADVNGDNIVNIFDLVLAGGNFGETISPW